MSLDVDGSIVKSLYQSRCDVKTLKPRSHISTSISLPRRKFGSKCKFCTSLPRIKLCVKVELTFGSQSLKPSGANKKMHWNLHCD